MGPLGVAIPLPRRAARKRFAQIAQLVEQGTENPRVAGSIPAGGTKASPEDTLCILRGNFPSFAVSMADHMHKIDCDLQV